MSLFQFLRDELREWIHDNKIRIERNRRSNQIDDNVRASLGAKSTGQNDPCSLNDRKQQCGTKFTDFGKFIEPFPEEYRVALLASLYQEMAETIECHRHYIELEREYAHRSGQPFRWDVKVSARLNRVESQCA